MHVIRERRRYIVTPAHHECCIVFNTRIARVEPVLMLMQNMSQGALGGGISAAVARALGAGDSGLADSLARNAVVLSATIGLVFSVVLSLFSVPLFRFLGAEGASLDAALTYGRVLFASLVPLWVMSALAACVARTVRHG